MSFVLNGLGGLFVSVPINGNVVKDLDLLGGNFVLFKHVCLEIFSPFTMLVCNSSNRSW